MSTGQVWWPRPPQLLFIWDCLNFALTFEGQEVVYPGLLCVQRNLRGSIRNGKGGGYPEGPVQPPPPDTHLCFFLSHTRQPPPSAAPQGHRALRPAQLVWRGGPPILSPCGFSKSGDPQLGDRSSAHLPYTHIHITHSHTHHTTHSLIHTHSHPHAYTLSDFSNVSLFFPQSI